MENKHLKAILKKLEGERDEHVADLEVYLMSPVGVGEHSAIGKEIEKKIGLIEELDGKIETIKKYYGTPKTVGNG
tara:strand:+ start:328 stop:552 length:225 start_codon:yes stop_codon:yes gene_type:complete